MNSLRNICLPSTPPPQKKLTDSPQSCWPRPQTHSPNYSQTPSLACGMVKTSRQFMKHKFSRCGKCFTLQRSWKYADRRGLLTSPSHPPPLHLLLSVRRQCWECKNHAIGHSSKSRANRHCGVVESACRQMDSSVQPGLNQMQILRLACMTNGAELEHCDEASAISRCLRLL